MKCPTCVATRVRSTVYVGPTSVTSMYCQPYYDEYGRYHHHDSNHRSSSFTCSYGHSWSQSIDPPQCPGCPWPRIVAEYLRSDQANRDYDQWTAERAAHPAWGGAK